MKVENYNQTELFPLRIGRIRLIDPTRKADATGDSAVFGCNVMPGSGTGLRKRSCFNNKLLQNDDSKKKSFRSSCRFQVA
jgi:hypothetical protein